MKRMLCVMCAMCLMCSTVVTAKEVYPDNINHVTISETLEDMYPAGSYYVGGEEMESGEYVIFPNAEDGTAFVYVYPDAVGDIISIAEKVEGNYIVTLEDGQCLTMQNAYAVPIDLVSDLDTSGPGMYKIGVHMDEGYYTIVPDKDVDGYYCVYADEQQDYMTKVGTIKKPEDIYVMDGQYLLVRDASVVSVNE